MATEDVYSVLNRGASFFRFFDQKSEYGSAFYTLFEFYFVQSYSDEVAAGVIQSRGDPGVFVHPFE